MIEAVHLILCSSFTKYDQETGDGKSLQYVNGIYFLLVIIFSLSQ